MTYLVNALQIIQTLQNKGYIAYFAGGYVRDKLMNHISEDIDIVTSASPKEIQQFFPKTIPIGAQFGIIMVVIDKDEFEVATFRREGKYEDGRHPSRVEMATPLEDAKRRDFTINGLFLNPVTEEIFDFVEGRADIERKIIRAIGNASARFEEDRLRMLRAIRYACRFDFTIESLTYAAIKKHSKELLPSVSMERIYQELSKMADYPRFDKALLMFFDVGLLQTIFPSLSSLSYETLKNRLNHLGDLPIASPVAAKLSLLFGKIGNEELSLILKKLKISNKDTSFALYFNHLKNLIEGHTALSRYEKAKLYADVHFALSFEMIKILHTNEAAIEEHEHSHIALALHIERLQKGTPLINAATLQDMGVKSGPQMGALLRQAEEISIEKDLHDAVVILQIMGYHQR